MGKYYVAGIPFDSENSLKHYGVKGMEWNKHKFGIDADDRYIKWLKNAGQNIGRFANNAAQNVAKGATAAAKTVGSAVNKGANFVTGNQNRQEYNNQSAAARMMRNPQQAQARAKQNYESKQAKTLPGIANAAAQNAGKAIGTAAGNAKDWGAQAAKNAGNWAGEAAKKAADVALWPASREGVANAARNVGNAVSGAAQNAGRAVQNAAQNVGEFVTGRNANENLERLYAENIANGGNGMSPELTEARNRYNQTLPGMAEKAADNIREDVIPNMEEAAQNVGNAVSGAANRAAEGAKGFLNSAGQWVSGAANNVKNTASKAASDVTKGATGFLNSAGQWVSNAAGNVGKAAQDAGKAVSNAAQNVGNTVGQAAEQARGGIGGFFDRVGNAVGGAANAVGDWAGNAAKDVGNAVGGAANSVGDWAGQAVQDVGGAVQNAGNWVGEQARNVGGAVTGAANNVGEFLTGRNANDNLERLYAENIANGGNGMSPELTEARNRYNQTLPGMAERAMDNIREGVIPDVQEAVGNAGNWIGDRARDVGQAVSNVPKNVANWYTGQPYADHSNMLRTVQDDKMATANRMMDLGTNMIGQSFDAEPPWGMSPDSSAYAQKAKDDHKRMLNAGLDVRNAGYDKMREAYAMNTPIHDADERYKSAPRQVLNSAGDWIGDRARDIGQAVGNAASSAANWVGDRVFDAEYAMKQPARTRLNQEWVSKRNQIYNDVAKKYGVDPNVNGMILDQKSGGELERRLEELSAEYSRKWDEIDRNPIGTAIGNMFHSALSEKPDGVSDAFWEKFTADGGTREEYERDWR